MTRKTKATKTDAGLPLDTTDAAKAAPTTDAAAAAPTADAAKAEDQTSERHSPEPDVAPDPAPDPALADAKADAETPPEDEAPEAPKEGQPEPAPATGVIPVFVLADGPLGEHGRVVRVSRRKLADLDLVQGKHWETPTAAQLAIGG